MYVNVDLGDRVGEQHVRQGLDLAAMVAFELDDPGTVISRQQAVAKVQTFVFEK